MFNTHIFKKQDSNSNAFTIIELLVVIAIIGLISSVVLVSMKGSTGKAKIAKGLEFSQTLMNVIGADAVGIWTFDEGSGGTAHDKSGYGNHGTLKGGAKWVDGEDNTPHWYVNEGQGRSALEFDGGNDHITIGKKINPSEVTIEAWINIGAHGNYNYIVSNARDCCGSYNGIDFRAVGGGKILAKIWNSSSASLYSDTTLKANRWYHIVFTYKNPNMVIYVNGKEDAKATSNLGIGQPSSYNTAIGGMGMNPAVYNLDGLLDEVRIYERALDSSEIQQHYADGAEKHGITIALR